TLRLNPKKVPILPRPRCAHCGKPLTPYDFTLWVLAQGNKNESVNKMSEITPLRLRPRDLFSFAMRLTFAIATGTTIGAVISYVIFVCTG
ncbi:MAG TPA: hypothetical protein VI958_11145, partial [Acidobacteriota bacterium]